MHGRINAERNEDGLYEVETDSPVNGKRVNLFSGEQLDGMVEPAVRAEVETENATEQTAAPQNTPATEPASAIQRVPVNEQTGEPMFEKTDTETALDALNEMTGADETTTAAIVDAQVEQAKKNLEALKKKKPVKKAVLKGTPMEMLKAQQEANAKHEAAMEQYNAQVTEAESAVNAWSNIQSLMKERKRAERAQTGTAPAGNAPQATQVEGTKHTEDVDENGHPFIKSSNGSTVFGQIAEDSGLPAAPIKLSEGFNVVDEKGNNQGYGLLHIQAGHGDEILAAGYGSVKDFVEDVAKNYGEIRIGRNRKGNKTYMLLELHDEKHKRTLYIELSHDGAYWNVNSGGIFRNGLYPMADYKCRVIEREKLP